MEWVLKLAAGAVVTWRPSDSVPRERYVVYGWFVVFACDVSGRTLYLKYGPSYVVLINIQKMQIGHVESVYEIVVGRIAPGRLENIWYIAKI